MQVILNHHASFAGTSLDADVQVLFPLSWITYGSIQGVNAIHRPRRVCGVYSAKTCTFTEIKTLDITGRSKEQQEATDTLLQCYYEDEERFYTALLYASCGATPPSAEPLWQVFNVQSREHVILGNIQISKSRLMNDDVDGHVIMIL